VAAVAHTLAAAEALTVVVVLVASLRLVQMELQTLAVVLEVLDLELGETAVQV
jgi:hypothetical protein